MTKVLAVNTGSSSLKIQLLDMPEAELLVSGVVERIGLSDGVFTLKFNGEKDSQTLDIPNHKVAAQLVLKGLIENKIVQNLNEIVAVGHRIVHGGEEFSESTESSEEIVKRIEALSDLAPLHNPANLTGFSAFKKALPDATHTFVYDTAFHQTIAEEIFMYPLPYEYYTDLRVRRYGFHGISHEYVAGRSAELMGREQEGLNVITLHLGGGASLTAVKDGKCVNTSMGFTPLSGVMMGTRTGDIDPAVVTYLMEKLDITAHEVLDIFNKKSGMAGVSGLSSDARDVIAGIEAGNERAILTRKMYVQSILHYVGAFAMQLGRVDALAFTAGLGERDDAMRAAVLDALQVGLHLDYDKQVNRDTFGVEKRLSTDASDVEVWVVPTNEELVIAEDAYRIHNENK